MDHLHNKIVEVANLLVLLLCVLHFLCFFYNCKAGRFAPFSQHRAIGAWPRKWCNAASSAALYFKNIFKVHGTVYFDPVLSVRILSELDWTLYSFIDLNNTKVLITFTQTPFVILLKFVH